jgi:glycosyltransferase involved in cell wall biosynthesis
MSPITPQIAIVMPVYNPGDALAMTLESLRQQTVPFRLYLVDDGSSSKPDYNDLLRGLDCRLILLEENRGVSIAANTAIEAALGTGHEFIARMDCGDWCHPQRLELSRSFLAANPGVDLVGTWAVINSQNTGLNYLFTPPTDSDALVRGLNYTMPFINPSIMARSRLYQALGLYSAEVAEDYEFCRRAARAGFKIANLPYVLLRKIEDASSISVRKRRAQLWSRLRIQWHYRDWSIDFGLGMLRTLLLFIVPRVVLRRAKAAYGAGHNQGESLVGAAGFEPATPTPPE